MDKLLLRLLAIDAPARRCQAAIFEVRVQGFLATLKWCVGVMAMALLMGHNAPHD
jgi:hypothetical protein